MAADEEIIKEDVEALTVCCGGGAIASAERAGSEGDGRVDEAIVVNATPILVLPAAVLSPLPVSLPPMT